MLEVLEAEVEITMPGPWTSLYVVTERQDREARDDDPDAGSDMRPGDVFDLRNPNGDVIETSTDLRCLRDKQAKYNTVAVQG